MPSRRFELDARRAAAAVRTRLAEDLGRLVGDAGVSTRQLASATGLDRGHVARILRGETRPSLETYASLAVALGADLTGRLYPNTGTRIRDRHQAQMLEWLLDQLHPRWQPFTELAVRKPARGWIDAAFHEPRASLFVATEVQSELRRLEQTIRWSAEKADSIPSWAGWAQFAPVPQISRLLVVRRTRATKAVAIEFSRQLRVAYPAHPDDAVMALTGTLEWPGAAIVWVTLDARGVRFAAGR